MKRFSSLLRIISLGFLLLGLLSALNVGQAAAQAKPITGEGSIVNPFGGDSIPFTIEFYARGGEVTGVIYAYSSNISMQLPAGYQQSGSSSYPDCPISGTFDGGDGGAFHALVTCSGTMQDHITGPSVDMNLTGTTNYTAQFEGQLFADGNGSGDVAMALVVKTDPYSMMGTDFPASTSPETAYGSEWTLTYPADEFTAAFVTDQPTQSKETEATESSEATLQPATTAEPASTVEEPSSPQVAPAVQSPNPMTKKAQSPLIPVGGAVIGTSTALLLSLAMQNKGQMVVGGVKDGFPSPVNGRMVSADEANWQSEQIARGNTWDENLGGFRVKTQQENQPSILSREYQEEKAYRATHKSPIQQWCDDQLQQIHEERIKDICQQMDINQADYQKYMKDVRFYNNASMAASVVKAGADFGVDVLADLTGPVGENIKMVYDVTTNSIEAYGEYQELGYPKPPARKPDQSSPRLRFTRKPVKTPPVDQNGPGASSYQTDHPMDFNNSQINQHLSCKAEGGK